MLGKVSVLLVASLYKESNSYRRYQALLQISPSVDAVNTDPFILMKRFAAVQHHFNIGPGIFSLNKVVREYAGKKKYDVVLVDNKPYLTQRTLRFIKKHQPAARIVNLLTDDPFGKFSRSWRLFRNTASLYDLFFVQRKVNIEELQNIGAAQVAICYRSFDTVYNRPIVMNADDLSNYQVPVGFIGNYEEERASFIAHLIENNVPVSVRGNGWPGTKYWDIIQPHYRGPALYGDDYIKAICGMDIALHFLRHANRDEQDSRTFEIPASRVFMLAEYTPLHLQLFSEDKEAVFFTSKADLLEKVRYYLSHKVERDHIAQAGYNRCITSGYDHKSRLEYVLTTSLDDRPVHA